MKIAIDIDEVLRETIAGFCDYYNKNYGGKLVYEDFQVYRISETLGISSEGAHKLLNEYFLSKDFMSVNVVSYADEAISILKESHELVALTASPDWMKDITLEFFNKHFPNSFSDLIFSGECYPGQNSQDKDEICKALGVDLIIEDSLLSQGYAEKGLKVLLLDKPWNKNIMHKNITRCSCWKEILNEIGRIENEK